MQSLNFGVFLLIKHFAEQFAELSPELDMNFQSLSLDLD